MAGQKSDKLYAQTPSLDSTDSRFFRDVLGTKEDTAKIIVGTDSSLIAYTKGLLNQAELILEDTAELQSDFTDGGRIDVILDELTAQGDTNEGKIDGIQTDLDDGTIGLGALKILSNDIQGELDDTTSGLGALKISIDDNQADLDNILADTNELQADWKDTGRLDTILDELTAQGDTNEGKLDANQTDLDAIIADVAAGSIEIEADASTTSTNIIDAAVLTQGTADWFKGAMCISLNGQNSGQARPVVNFTVATDSIDVYPAFLNTPDPGDDFLIVSSWRPNVLDQQPDVAVDTVANIAAGDIFDLNTAGLTYMVNNLRIKCADPGAETITFTLYELINDVSTAVDTFAVTTATYGTHFSLFDMFSVNHLAGDDIQITVSASADNSYVITGQYQYSQAYTG